MDMTVAVMSPTLMLRRRDKSKEAILSGEQSISGEGLELHTSDHLEHHSSLRSRVRPVSVTKSATHHFRRQLFQDKKRLHDTL